MQEKIVLPSYKVPPHLQKYFQTKLDNCYVCHLVSIFREVRRILRKDGTLWLNLGDSYARSPSKGVKFQAGPSTYLKNQQAEELNRDPEVPAGLKEKDLCMIPARVALALQADGWYLRSQIPWVKRNCMPESTKDRPTSAIEYFYLLTKSKKYFYNYEAVKLPASPDTHARYARGRSDNHKKPSGWDIDPGHHGAFHRKGRAPGVNPKCTKSGSGIKQNESFSGAVKDVVQTRMRRNSDWFFESFQGLLLNEEEEPLALIVNSKGTKEAHFATFPEKIVEPCIKAGSQAGDTILDPFSGSGTVGIVAKRLNRKAVLIELKKEYCDMPLCKLAQEKIFWGQSIKNNI